MRRVNAWGVWRAGGSSTFEAKLGRYSPALGGESLPRPEAALEPGDAESVRGPEDGFEALDRPSGKRTDALGEAASFGAAALVADGSMLSATLTASQLKKPEIASEPRPNATT